MCVYTCVYVCLAEGVSDKEKYNRLYTHPCLVPFDPRVCGVLNYLTQGSVRFLGTSINFEGTQDAFGICTWFANIPLRV